MEGAGDGVGASSESLVEVVGDTDEEVDEADVAEAEGGGTGEEDGRVPFEVSFSFEDFAAEPIPIHFNIPISFTSSIPHNGATFSCNFFKLG